MRVRTRAAVALAALVGWSAAAAGVARAQENPSPEQMRKMYDDALQQLKAAQERKNQLAAENEKLGKQVEAMQKDLAAAHGRVEELKRADAEHAERTFFLRSHYAAWQQFARAHPETADRWRLFIESDFWVSPRETGSLIDREWPTPTTRPSAASPIPPATQPAGTQPNGTQLATTQQAFTPPATSPAISATVPAPTTAPAPATQPASAAPAADPPSPAAPAATPPTDTQPAGTRPG